MTDLQSFSFQSTILDTSDATTVVEQDADTSGGKPQGQPSAAFPVEIILIMFGVMLMMFFMSSRGRKKQQQKHRDLIESLKEGDKIMLQNGKFVTVEKMDGDRVFVWGDLGRNVREVYHRNAVAMREQDVTSEAMQERQA